jgi:hypothetical protein
MYITLHKSYYMETISLKLNGMAFTAGTQFPNCVALAQGSRNAGN